MGIENWKERYGEWALIAGGSEGIGRAFAERLASAGVNLILLARKMGPLQDTASEIHDKYKVTVEVHSLDLVTADLPVELDRIVGDREIGTLIYNAGAVHGAGLFLDNPLEHATNLIKLNCVGPATFVHTIAPGMRARKRGAIILLSSMAALSGGGYVAAYSASKAYATTLAEGLWIELGSDGVDVLGVLAGATDTPAMLRSGTAFADASEDQLNIKPMDSYDVADEALAALGTVHSMAPGPNNPESAAWLRSAPREQTIAAMTGSSATLYGLPPLEVKANTRNA